MAIHPAVVAKQQEHIENKKRNFWDRIRQGSLQNLAEQSAKRRERRDVLLELPSLADGDKIATLRELKKKTWKSIVYTA
jgi:hypothetical protein